ncbi:16S rRNA (adenine1518-N6/adenine1519-N6)-dimethyltransferase [Entomoplasma freundtii]|uniref:Ribosomal RNA small subunit methyltransferase A n=1 Tax=Entomoplasma freundtii TaxID=74700 RepID=A0A2K8NTE9_9MOLU|nr:16S rRNA (adenine(1518)-N(6)/adenine(1519)-N(6))-dimethyltransferase RsmA [Entomoplasma freundtii]ATZ16031.1 16S rRNA (adenine1518-N6/adenine1519-N6)-dimethyltransferase [Entomoplasma freundtii]TDY58100.1 16S rRNA (adenine1518-N6/adenine1519-N6)-dimethyltransferase [Entomoplasma freundtii]
MTIQAKKHFGQNFIKDPGLIQKIVNLIPSSPEPGLVIEIGPGKGALTRELIKRFPQVVAIEIDSDLADYLATTIDSPKLEIINEDVLEINFEQLIQKYGKPNQPVYLISNLPYYITSPILFQVFANSQIFHKAIFMMQQEVAQRLTAEKNEHNYNNLSVVASFFGDKRYEFLVKSHYFQPQPKVDSAVISLTFKNDFLQKVTNPDLFVAFVRQLFNNRRKTILNNLGTYLGDKQKAKLVLEQVKIDPQKRPENLGLTEFLEIFELLDS